MEVVLGILILIAIVLVIMGIQKVIGIATYKTGKAINKNIIHRNEFKEEHEFVTEKLTFKSSASVTDIRNQLAQHVTAAPKPAALAADLYRAMEDSDSIVYGYGNTLGGETFQASLEFSNDGEGTEGIFQFTGWTESSGMITGIKHMTKLREGVVAAFTAADPSVKIIGSQIGKVNQKYE